MASERLTMVEATGISADLMSNEPEKPVSEITLREHMARARAARKPGGFARTSEQMRRAARVRWDAYAAEKAKKKTAQGRGVK